MEKAIVVNEFIIGFGPENINVNNKEFKSEIEWFSAKGDAFSNKGSWDTELQEKATLIKKNAIPDFLMISLYKKEVNLNLQNIASSIKNRLTNTKTTKEVVFVCANHSSVHPSFHETSAYPKVYYTNKIVHSDEKDNIVHSDEKDDIVHSDEKDDIVHSDEKDDTANKISSVLIQQHIIHEPPSIKTDQTNSSFSAPIKILGLAGLGAIALFIYIYLIKKT
jgi:hypothetical protein